MNLAVSVPGNILLMGEYAVLEEGGLGIAVAPDIRVTGSATILAGESSADGEPEVTVTGTMPGNRIGWPGDTGVLGKAADYLASSSPVSDRYVHIEIDSSDLFAANGRKRGLGSSAASVAVLTALWLAAGDDKQKSAEDVFRTAVAAHRAAQGGGSGYDVATSLFGGSIIFTGGETPRATPIDLPWMPGLSMVRGSQPVKSISAVAAYRKWKSETPAEASAFVARSNELVEAFAQSAGWDEAMEVLREYSELAINLATRIGVPATIEIPDLPAGAFGKAVGAGSELGVVLGAEGEAAIGAGLKWR